MNHPSTSTKKKEAKKKEFVELLESCVAPSNNPTKRLRKQSPAYINSKIELFCISSLFKDTANYELCSRGSLSAPGVQKMGFRTWERSAPRLFPLEKRHGMERRKVLEQRNGRLFGRLDFCQKNGGWGHTGIGCRWSLRKFRLLSI